MEEDTLKDIVNGRFLLEFADIGQVRVASRLARYNEWVSPKMLNWRAARRALAKIYLNFKYCEACTCQ